MFIYLFIYLRVQLREGVEQYRRVWCADSLTDIMGSIFTLSDICLSEENPSQCKSSVGVIGCVGVS